MINLSFSPRAFKCSKSTPIPNSKVAGIINFVSPVDPDLGDWLTGAAGRGIGIGTTGAATGTNSADYLSGATVGSVDILGSASRTFSIFADNFNNGGSGVDITGIPCSWNGGVSIAHVNCDYGGSGDMDCGTGNTAAAEPTPAGIVLTIGMDINTTASHADGDTAAPSFDIIVSYN